MATATMSSTAATTASASAPEIHSTNALSASTIVHSPSLDAFHASSPRGASPDALGFTSSPSSTDLASGSNDNSTEPDPQIVEALRSKDRLYVLKLGEQMESLIHEHRVKIDLTPATSYQKMLVHRCSAYYKLSPESDNLTKGITVYYRSESRIPARRISELVPLEESNQPAFKIMRRSAQDGSKSRQNSQAGSVAGEDADLSDVEPSSEAGSISGRSNATGSSAAKRHPTLEEREAAYNEARSRIFMGFEEKEKDKEKDKDKDMSANSSTFSLVSGSGSTNGGRGSSIGDLDDSASSAATESEWSGPVTRDKRDSRRGGSAGSSSRSMRSSGASYNNGSGSSRNSRATSPSFTYATLYEPPPVVDCQPYGAQPPPAGYVPHYFYGYGAPGQVPAPVYGYPYYPPYGYPPHPSDPTSQPSESVYSPAQSNQPQVPYPNPYIWQPPPSHTMHQPSQLQAQSPGTAGLNLPPHSSHPSSPQPQNVPQPHYPTYMAPPHFNPYAMQGYAPPPHGFQPPTYGPPAAQPPQQQLYMPEMAPNSAYVNGNADNNNHSRASSRSSGHHGTHKRSAPRARGSWSYGPGAGQNGYTYNLHSVGGGLGGNEAVGPRLSSSVRRISGTSSGSGSAGARTPGDEASSTASSSTSSSSRQTYTSTSSKHPLPARPDWAVGLKPQPGLHPPRHHDHSNANSRTMSPVRIGGQAHLPSQHQSQPALQPNDFPPLSSASVPERRTPVVGGVWTNTSSMRSIMTPGPQGSANHQGSALVHYPNNQQSASQNANGNPRLDDPESVFERPPPKGNAELFNPRGSRSAGSSNGNGERASMQGQIEVRDGTKQDNVWLKGEAVAVVVEKVGLVTLDDRSGEVDVSPSAAPRPSSAVPPPVGVTDGAADVGAS